MKSSILVLCCSLVLVLVLARSASADPDPVPTRTIAIDGAVAVPTGDWGDAIGAGFGGLIRFENRLAPDLVLTGRAGYLQHLAKDSQLGAGDTSVGEVPLLFGLRYDLMRGPMGSLYGAAEIGLVTLVATVDLGGATASSSQTNAAALLGVGCHIQKVDVRGGLWLPDLGRVNDTVAVMLTVGVDVASL
jgi:hypothetical protein